MPVKPSEETEAYVLSSLNVLYVTMSALFYEP